MLDKNIWGEVRRISPEAPVPMVLATHQSEQPGGAANVAMNLGRLGAQTTVAGFTGGDENEHLLAQCLCTNGIVPEFVVSNGFPTISKLRILGGGSRHCAWTAKDWVPAQRRTIPVIFRQCWPSCLGPMPSCFPTTPSEFSLPKSASR